MPGLRHVVGFDIDLTLLDTRARILASAVAGFADLGVRVAPEKIVPLLGVPLGDKASELAPQLDPEAFAAAYRDHYHRPGVPPSPAMPGAAEAIAAVHDGGGRVVVVSAKIDWMAGGALREAGLLELVDAVHGGLFAEQKAVALREEEAGVYVGDHPADMVAARDADATAVGVATGANEADALFTAGADVVLPDLLAFPRWWRAHVAG